MEVDTDITEKDRCEHVFYELKVLSYKSNYGLFIPPVIVVELKCLHCGATKRTLIKSLD